MSYMKEHFYNLRKDNDGHTYKVPCDKDKDFLEWLDLDEYEEDSWDEPAYAERVDGEGFRGLLDYQNIEATLIEGAGYFTLNLKHKENKLISVTIDQEDSAEGLLEIFEILGMKTFFDTEAGY